LNITFNPYPAHIKECTILFSISAFARDTIYFGKDTGAIPEAIQGFAVCNESMSA
jgi:hypothetical protein